MGILILHRKYKILLLLLLFHTFISYGALRMPFRIVCRTPDVINNRFEIIMLILFHTADHCFKNTII